MLPQPCRGTKCRTIGFVHFSRYFSTCTLCVGKSGQFCCNVI